MKNKYNKRRYKLGSGVQQIQMDTPDYSKAYELQAEEGAKNQGIKNAASQFSGAYAPIGQLGGMASDVIKSHNKSKGGAQLGGAVSMGASGAALGMQLGGPWGAAIGAVGGGIYGAVTGGKEYEKGKKLQKEAEHKTAMENANKGFATSATTDAQSALAKKGKYKLKSKQPRMIETEGREPIFSPKKADGTRDLLYYNPSDPTHSNGGVKAMVMPKNRYNNGTNNLMPKRPASKYSLVGNGNMAVGAKQLKVNTLNNTALSGNLTGMPAVNAANKFIQPMAGISQVARNIPEVRRKEKIRTERSHKKSNPDANKIVNPPLSYEMKPPPPRSTFNTKNDFKNGGKAIKVYAEGSSNLEIKKFAPGGSKLKASSEEIETVKRIQRKLGVKDDGVWKDITQKAWENRNKPSSVKNTNKPFNLNFNRAEQERKADSTQYANNVFKVATMMANKNMSNVVTESRPTHKNYGKKTGNNTCLTSACAINKMTGTNLPFDLTIARNSDPRVGDNPIESRFNPSFLTNHKKLGYKLLKPTDKMQPGDLMQVSKEGVPAHARVFLGNNGGPIVAEDHGENTDDKGVEIENETYRGPYKTVADAKNEAGWVYRYMGLPKKETAKIIKNQKPLNKSVRNTQIVKNVPKATFVPEVIDTPKPEKMELMKKGSSKVKVFK